MIRLLIVTIFFFSFQSKDSLPTIEISTIDMDILTRYHVKCSEFEQSFQNDKKLRTLGDQKQIEKFLLELKHLKKMKGNQDIDVRAQILIKYKDHVDIMCADKFSIYSNGTRYAISTKMKKLIWG
ncbi:MAG: hypothetical protein QM734_07835 [Cyclobacteriaceae bacterium]